MRRAGCTHSTRTRVCNKKCVDEGKIHLIVDGHGLDYISSAGLGVFMAYIEEIRTLNGDIKICALKPKVFGVFDLLGFPRIYHIVETEEEACLSLTKEFNLYSCIGHVLCVWHSYPHCSQRNKLFEGGAQICDQARATSQAH